MHIISTYKTESESLTAVYHALLTLKLLIFSSHHHRPPQHFYTVPTSPSVLNMLSERKLPAVSKQYKLQAAITYELKELL